MRASRQLVDVFCVEILSGGRPFFSLARHFYSASLKANHGTNNRLLSKEKNWPGSALGCLESPSTTFPLPGDVTSAASLTRTFTFPMSLPLEARFAADTLPKCIEESRVLLLQDAVDRLDLLTPYDRLPLECAAHACPATLRRDFQQLFPERNLEDGALTVITLCQRTNLDMSGWSAAVEKERTYLLDSFMIAASQICYALRRTGLWADFIDPSCGKPYLSSSNSTLLETDQRFEKLGFEIEDLGCCKVIRHHEWGTHAFVGCLFTEASLNHSIINEVLKRDVISDLKEEYLCS